MITWTASGVVTTPDTIQIRLSKQNPSEIRAGAPTPTRILSPEEFQDNLDYFRFTLDGPRSQACTKLTLSGLQRENAAYFEILVQYPHFQWITLHIDPSIINWTELAEYQQCYHRLSIPINDLHQAQSIPQWAIDKCHIILLLEQGLENWIEPIITLANQRSWNPLIFLYPFPLLESQHSTTLSPKQCLDLLEKHCRSLHNPPIIKGLPHCLLDSSFSVHSKTSNRWYVDASHQREKALLFFPDILSFHKDDQCRFCRFTGSCDGFFTIYLEQHDLCLQAIE